MIPVLKARALAKTYHSGGDQVRALDSVDLIIERGDFVAIMGPSGCGKSTLLNLLAGFARRSAGEVWLTVHGAVLAPWWHLALIPVAVAAAAALTTSMPARLAAQIPVAEAVRYE